VTSIRLEPNMSQTTEDAT